MAERHDDGSVTLTRDEVLLLESHIRRWYTASELAGANAAAPLVDLGVDVAAMLGRRPRT